MELRHPEPLNLMAARSDRAPGHGAIFSAGRVYAPVAADRQRAVDGLQHAAAAWGGAGPGICPPAR
ncbi:hypothetical protein AKJ12_17715 [Xanthomonas arboricola pv. juglandis]|nr:hypothetical protein AKJ12_17715 [Xanthomonas arboricola pv. juglandis]KOB22235.1 hypothetical protein AE927_20965 [Xanthomonas arboricola]KOB49354.1 hypothetical protein AE932_12605 [Xanthomonas arboricola]